MRLRARCGSVVVDSRLPGRWLTDAAMRGLSDKAWRALTNMLMWSNEQQTDGAVPRSVGALLVEGGLTRGIVRELLNAGLAAETDSGVQLLNWSETQTPADELADRRKRNKESKAKARARPRTATAVGSEGNRDVEASAIPSSRVDEDAQMRHQ